MRRSVILALAASLAAGGSAIYLASSASAAAACYPAWSAATVYVKDNNVSYQSKNYTAKWWTLGEVPTRQRPVGRLGRQGRVRRHNAAAQRPAAQLRRPADSADRPSPPPPSTPPPVSGLPKHALIGYLHSSFANGSGYLKMADVPGRLGHHQPRLR